MKRATETSVVSCNVNAAVADPCSVSVHLSFQYSKFLRVASSSKSCSNDANDALAARAAYDLPPISSADV